MPRELNCIVVLLAAVAGRAATNSADETPPPAPPGNAAPAAAAAAWPRGRVIVADPAGRRALSAALDRRIGFHANDEPIKAALERLSKAADVDIELDVPAVESHFARGAEDKTLRLTAACVDIALRDVLEQSLEPLGLAFIGRDERILVTTRTRAEGLFELRIYQVHDLVARPDAPDGPRRFDRLIEALTATIEPESWYVFGSGRATVRSWESPGVLALVILHRPDVHDRIETFFDTLRAGAAKNLPVPANDAPPKPLAAVWSGASLELEGPPTALVAPGGVHFTQTAAERKARRALETRLALEVRDESLRDTLHNLAKVDGFALSIEESSLAADGQDPDRKINFRSRECRLDRILRRLLEPRGLAYATGDEGLIITTQTDYETLTSPRLYETHDLVWNARRPNLEDQCELIFHVVERETWIEGTGTPGNPWPVHLPGVQGLLVTQTEEIHREVAELLSMLRRARSNEVYEFQRRRSPAAPRPRQPGAAPIAKPGTPTDAPAGASGGGMF